MYLGVVSTGHARTLDSHPGCCAMYMYVPGTQNMRNTCGCKRNGVLLGWEGGCNASIPSLSANLSSPRSLAPHSTADPPQLSTLCQMLASLKNVLARPDARKSAALGPPSPLPTYSTLFDIASAHTTHHTLSSLSMHTANDSILYEKRPSCLSTVAIP